MISAGHRHDVQTWCLDNDFELVELEAEVGSEEDGNKCRKLYPGWDYYIYTQKWIL